MGRRYSFATENHKERMRTKQFSLSEELLDKRFAMEKTFEEMAVIAGFPKEVFIKMEYGDADIPVSYYENALRNIENYQKWVVK